MFTRAGRRTVPPGILTRKPTSPMSSRLPRRVRQAAAALALALLPAATGCAVLADQLERQLDAVLLDVDPVDRDAPFAGTPAEDYADGSAGFTVPELAPAGDFPVRDVAFAYATTKQLLEAVYLNEEAVFDENNSEFVGLLQGEALEWFLQDYGHEDWTQDSRHTVFNLAPNSAELIGDVVKVDGHMSAEEAWDEGPYLRVETEYVIVYPIARPGGRASTRLVVTHLGEVQFYYTDSGRMEFWPVWGRSAGPSHCLEESLITPFFYDEMPRGEQPTGSETDPYDLEQSRDQEDCQAISAT